jgi:hypothetical protein
MLQDGELYGLQRVEGRAEWDHQHLIRFIIIMFLYMSLLYFTL